MHKDLMIMNLNLLGHIYPELWKKPIAVFVEANLTQDLAAYMEHQIKAYFRNNNNNNNNNNKRIQFVKQHDRHGQVLPGVLTQHKANLVSYFKRVLDEGKLFFAERLSSVARVVLQKHDNNMTTTTTTTTTTTLKPPPPPLLSSSSRTDSEETFHMLLDQLKSFRCYKKGKTQIVYSGKKTGPDDMVMALIIGIAWLRLPENNYILI